MSLSCVSSIQWALQQCSVPPGKGERMKKILCGTICVVCVLAITSQPAVAQRVGDRNVSPFYAALGPGIVNYSVVGDCSDVNVASMIQQVVDESSSIGCLHTTFVRVSDSHPILNLRFRTHTAKEYEGMGWSTMVYFGRDSDNMLMVANRCSDAVSMLRSYRHELGHAFGLLHANDYVSIMNGSNDVRLLGNKLCAYDVEQMCTNVSQNSGGSFSVREVELSMEAAGPCEREREPVSCERSSAADGPSPPLWTFVVLALCLRRRRMQN
jgi:hypothetical protein